jgi:4-hydroxy-3-methylbut-2-enyl diphosphate reductase
MVVVGGKESANTSRLTRLIQEEGAPVFHVETDKELDKEKLSGYDTIGVTAGASTPNWMIRKVISRLEEIQISRYSFPLKHFYSLFILFIKSNLYVAAGAACLVYTSCLLQSIDPRLSYMGIASLYIFAMHVLHYLTKGREIQLEEPTRGDFVEKYKNILIALSVVSILCSLFIASSLGALPFWLLMLATILGILYNIRIIPVRLLRFFYYQRLRDIPASKDVFMALAWAAITVVLPALAEGRIIYTENLLVTFLFIYVLVYNRSIFFDIKEIQGDKMVGRETMPIFIGKERTKVIIVALMLLAFIGLIHSTYKGNLPELGYLLTVLLLYNAAYLFLYHKRIFTHSLICEFIADGKFILAGILSFFWKNLLP